MHFAEFGYAGWHATLSLVGSLVELGGASADVWNVEEHVWFYDMA